jgi:hypothetical protein
MRKRETHDDEHPLVRKHLPNVDMSNTEEYGTADDISKWIGG